MATAGPHAAQCEIRPDALPGAFRLWSWILAPPLLWIVRLTGSYALVPFACGWGSVLPLHLLTFATLLGTLLVGVPAWRASRRSGHPAAGAEDFLQRVRFMALVGLLSAALFAAVIAAEGIFNFLVDPCLMPARRSLP